MKKLVAMVILHVINFALSLRYRVRFKGLDKLTPENLNKPGGLLFLPNHPTILVDPSLVVIGVYRRFPIRPLIVEYMYYTPGVKWLMSFMDALPVPNHQHSTNSLKRKKSEKALSDVEKGLWKGENFLIYPAGKVKRSNYELIGGASGVHSVLQKAPDTNVVLVKVTGLYGSIFSVAPTGQVPYLFPTIWQGIKIAVKNLIFFTPRREVTIEYVPVGPEFPANASRLEFNKYLEHWYNAPDGLDPALAEEKAPGESLHLVSHSFWRQELPLIEADRQKEQDVDLSRIPQSVQNKVVKFLAELSERSPEDISPVTHLSSDLGLDSLDAADILAFLQDQFEVEGVPPSELTTVERVMAIAAKEVTFEVAEDDLHTTPEAWMRSRGGTMRAQVAPGNTITEAFLNNCARMGKRPAVADDRSGVLSYSTLKLRVLLLAEHLRKLEGRNIGIMLPATVAASACILACQLAGKVPVMVNWTVGSRHLESVTKLSGVQHVLSSWAFLDRIENVDLDCIEDKLILLEDLRSEFSVKDKLRALVRSRWSTKKILRTFDFDKVSGDSQAVLLFTSGTEGMPKGVPLTHRNILSNHHSVLEALEITTDDSLFGVLPPFHAFGFTISSLIGLVSGIKTAFYPNPTNGRGLARGMKRWNASIICGAPTFLKAMLRASKPEDLEHLRYCVTGAEKAPPELFALCAKFDLEHTVLEGYGITECAPVLTLNLPNEKHVGVGKPLPGVQLCTVHPDTHQVLPQGERGLILARGPNIFSGYLNPDIAPPFLNIEGESWYVTGDLGFLSPEGHLTLAGRQKRFVKIGGEMVSLGGIEEALLESAQEAEWPVADDRPALAVVAQEREGEKARVVLFTTFNTSVGEVNALLRKSGFSNLVRVSDISQIEEIPIMGSGKIHYRDLQAQVGEVAPEPVLV